MTDIFKYLDYRKYLKDTFDEKKALNPSFTFRTFSRLANFSSSNYLMLIMQGKRNLSGEGVVKVARALKLKKSETEFFENLVRFNQAKGDSEKNFYYSRISANRKYAASRPLEKGQFEYYSKWYVPVIRELVTVKGFDETPEWIVAHITPLITAKEARDALNLLLSIGLLERDMNGKLIQNDRHISSGDDVANLAMANFQREMIALSTSSIDVSNKDREIGSITFATSREKLTQAKTMIRDFRSKLSAFLAEGEDADAVFQFNLQLFELASSDGGKTQTVKETK